MTARLQFTLQSVLCCFWGLLRLPGFVLKILSPWHSGIHHVLPLEASWKESFCFYYQEYALSHHWVSAKSVLSCCSKDTTPSYVRQVPGSARRWHESPHSSSVLHFDTKTISLSGSVEGLLLLLSTHHLLQEFHKRNAKKKINKQLLNRAPV